MGPAASAAEATAAGSRPASSSEEEVLFGADERLLAALVAGVRAAPDGAGAPQLVRAGLQALAHALQPDREGLRVRARVLASDIALQGRDLAKQARWSAVVADELGARGVPAPAAALLAAAGAGAFRVAYAGWLADRARTTLATRVARTLDDLAAVLAA